MVCYCNHAKDKDRGTGVDKSKGKGRSMPILYDESDEKDFFERRRRTCFRSLETSGFLPGLSSRICEAWIDKVRRAVMSEDRKSVV